MLFSFSLASSRFWHLPPSLAHQINGYLLALAEHEHRQCLAFIFILYTDCIVAAVAVEAAAVAAARVQTECSIFGVDGESALRFNGYGLPCPWTTLYKMPYIESARPASSHIIFIVSCKSSGCYARILQFSSEAAKQPSSATHKKVQYKTS